MSLDDIPFEVFFTYLIPYLLVKDVCKLAMVSNGLKELCDENEVWKEIFVRKKKHEYSSSEMLRVLRKCANIPRFIPLPHFVGPSPGQVLIIFANMSDVPYDIFQYIDLPKQGIVKRYETIKPGCIFRIRSYIGHKWAIIHHNPKETDNLRKSHVFRVEEDFVLNDHPVRIKYFGKIGKIIKKVNKYHAEIQTLHKNHLDTPFNERESILDRRAGSLARANKSVKLDRQFRLAVAQYDHMVNGNITVSGIEFPVPDYKEYKELISINIGGKEKEGWMNLCVEDETIIKVRNYKNFKKQYMKSCIPDIKKRMKKDKKENDNLRDHNVNRKKYIEEELLSLKKQMDIVNDVDKKTQQTQEFIDYVKTM